MRVALAVCIVSAVVGGVWFAISQADSTRSPIDEVQNALEEDAAKGVFEGRIGDFAVYSRAGPERPETQLRCPEGAVAETTTDQAQLKGHELWTDRLGEAVAGVSCNEGIIAINSGVGPIDGAQSIVKAYASELPVPVLFEAPRDRIEIIDVQGRQGIIEIPVEDYPYATSSLVVLERAPSDGRPGVVIYVNFADSEEQAIELAKAMMQP
jgi:hypothetical protein